MSNAARRDASAPTMCRLLFCRALNTLARKTRAAAAAADDILRRASLAGRLHTSGTRAPRALPGGTPRRPQCDSFILPGPYLDEPTEQRDSSTPGDHGKLSGQVGRSAPTDERHLRGHHGHELHVRIERQLRHEHHRLARRDRGPAVGSIAIDPLACSTPVFIASVIAVAALPMSI